MSPSKDGVSTTTSSEDAQQQKHHNNDDHDTLKQHQVDHNDHDHHDRHHHGKVVSSALDPEVEAKGVQAILAGLSEEEKQQLVDDNMPLRHFRAEKGNEVKALHQLQETLKWRKSFGVDDIIHAKFNSGGENETAQMLRKENETGKIYVRGYDTMGRALMYMRPQRENTHNHENNMKNLVYNLERAIACTAKQSNHTQDKICLVIDFDGFQLRTAPPLSVSRTTLDILQKHYPERMHRAYVCNAPFIFRTFFLMVRPFIDPITKQKIVICHGKHGYDTLSEHINVVQDMEPSILTKLQIPKQEDGTTTTTKPPMKEFDHNEYFATPFDTAFDEK